MRTAPAALASILALSVALPAAAQAPSPPPPVAAQVRETAGCAAVFMVMAQLAADPQVTGDNPLAGALGASFARSFQQKGRGLYARAAEQARRDRMPPEAVFEAGVGYLIESYAAAQTRTPGASVDFTTEAARLVERCVTAFPDAAAEF